MILEIIMCFIILITTGCSNKPSLNINTWLINNSDCTFYSAGKEDDFGFKKIDRAFEKIKT